VERPALREFRTVSRVRATSEKIEDIAEDGPVFSIVEVSNEIGVHGRGIDGIDTANYYYRLTYVASAWVRAIKLL
jgi:hypothetical protein